MFERQKNTNLFVNVLELLNSGTPELMSMPLGFASVNKFESNTDHF